MAGVHTEVHLENETLHHLTAFGCSWLKDTFMNCIEE